MPKYVKINNTWRSYTNIWKKVSGTWVLQTSGDVTSVLNVLPYFYGGHIPGGPALEIQGVDECTGKYFFLTATYGGNTVYPSWTLTSGSQYASVNSNGKVTINEGVTNQSITVTATYDGHTATKTIQVSYDNQFTIEGPDTMTGTSGNVMAKYNSSVVSPSWSITSGSQYASINSSGQITILGSGVITVSATYNNYTATKNITLVYQANTSTETQVDPDTGAVTTTETTTTTDPQTGAVTETSTSTTTNEDGSTSVTESETVTNTDGSGTSSSTTTNSDGTSSQSNTTINSDTSSSTTTTNYDENGDPTSGSNNTVDTSGNSNTQDLTYDENGDPYVSGYTIDTSGNTSGNGETISGGLDTGFIAFDGRPFTIHMVCKVNPTDQPASGATMFLAALEHNGNKYAGFCVDLYKRNQVVSMASTSGSINNNGFGSRVTGSINGSTAQQLLQYVKTNGGVQTLTIDITYTPASYNPQYKYVIKVTPLYTSATGTSKKTDANSTLSSNSGYLPASLANATVVVGSFGVEHTHDMTNLEVIELEVKKL